jgi:ABC-type transport system involved in multi-copper enzyme maturation permease subunit
VVVIVYAYSGAKSTIENHPRFHAGRVLTFTQYVWVLVYKGYFLTIFSLSSFLFGVGSPTQEKANGSALFTLSLPVKRKSLIEAKVFTASLEIILISFIMALIIVVMALPYGYSYPLKDALLFGALMTCGGLVFMVIGFLLSLMISKEAVIIPLGTALMAVVFFVTKLPALEKANIFNFMTGAGYLSNDSFLFIKALNAVGILILLGTVYIGMKVARHFFALMDI